MSSVGYEIFVRKVSPEKSPTVSITSYARINLNSTAASKLAGLGVQHVLLLCDTDHHRIALRPISKKDNRTYTLKYLARNRGAGFSAKTFLDHYNIDYSHARSFPATWNEEQGILEIELPPDLFKTLGSDELSELSLQTASLDGLI